MLENLCSARLNRIRLFCVVAIPYAGVNARILEDIIILCDWALKRGMK